MSAFFRSPRVWIPALIVAVVALAFHPVVFGKYTLSTGPLSKGDGPNYADSACPLHDPSAGANQDEGWLQQIRRDLASGHLPLVNMSNGMGAPLVESLQPGALYLLNPLLLLLDPTTPRFFDTFSLLHVVLFVAGLYALLRAYASRGASLAVAILVGLSGLVVDNVNMVHFRCHAWFPLLLLGAVQMARGNRRAWPFFLFVIAHVAQMTAGALQEAFVCSLAAGAVFCIEWWWASADAGPRVRRLARMSAAAICSTAISSVAWLPYLFTRASGDLGTASNPERSISFATGGELSNWVLPNANGFYPYVFTPSGQLGHWLPDFSTLGVFLVLAGAAALACAARPAHSKDRARYLAISIVVVLGVAKMAGLPLFDFLQHVPFLSEVLYLKYHNWLFTVAAILAAAGIDALIASRARSRRWIAVGAAVVTAALVVWLVSLTWPKSLDELLANVPASTVRDARFAYDTSIAAFLAGACVVFLRPRGALAALVVLAIAHATLVLPNGWQPRAAHYAASIERQDEEDPNLVEPDQLGLRPRLMSRIQPNQNLIPGFENLGVFDPVCNTRLVELLQAHFHLNHPLFDIQPNTSPDEPLRAKQMMLLRFLGVSRVYGYDIDPGLHFPRTPAGGLLTRGAMPRVWLLSDADAGVIEEEFGAARFAAALRKAREVVLPNDKQLEVHATSHGYDLRVSRDFHGELVVQQAYAKAWRFEDESGRVFCNIFPRWSVDLVAGRTYRIRYVPLGFGTSLAISALGCVLLTLSGLFLLRRL